MMTETYSDPVPYDDMLMRWIEMSARQDGGHILGFESCHIRLTLGSDFGVFGNFV